MELTTKLHWSAAEANQRVLAVTQELTATHNAALDRAREEAAARARVTQEALIVDSKTSIEAVRTEATKQRQEAAALVAQLQQKLHDANTDLSEAQSGAAHAQAALEREREQRQRLATSLAEQRSQVARLEAARSSPTPAELQLRKDLEGSHEKQRQVYQALLAARSAAERIEAALGEERQRRDKLTAQVAELQTRLATTQKARLGPTAQELQLQKELAGLQGKLHTANQTKQDIERPWRQRVQELEQQVLGATEEQKKLQAQVLAAKQAAQTRASDVYRRLDQVSVSKVFEGPASPIIEGPARYPFPLPADARAKREAETASGQRASW